MELLDRLQDMEKRLGRVKLIEKGPRSIDLDIITYGQVSMQSERLTIPHALMHEREFVLRPMQEYVKIAATAFVFIADMYTAHQCRGGGIRSLLRI